MSWDAIAITGEIIAIVLAVCSIRLGLKVRREVRESEQRQKTVADRLRRELRDPRAHLRGIA